MSTHWHECSTLALTLVPCPHPPQGPIGFPGDPGPPGDPGVSVSLLPTPRYRGWGWWGFCSAGFINIVP